MHTHYQIVTTCTFSHVILTRAASNIGRQHSWTCQIPCVCRSASKCKQDQAASGDNKGIGSPPCGRELACINHTRYPRQRRQYVQCALLPTRQRTIAPAAMPIKPQTLRRPAHWLSRKFIQPSAIQSACLFSLRQWQIDPCVTRVYWYACCLVLHLNASTTHALFAHSLTDRHNSHVLTCHSCSPSLSIGWHNSRTGTYLKSTATPPSATEIRQPLWQWALSVDHMQSSRQ